MVHVLLRAPAATITTTTACAMPTAGPPGRTCPLPPQVSVVCIGGGGGSSAVAGQYRAGGAGGGLGWANNITVRYAAPLQNHVLGMHATLLPGRPPMTVMALLAWLGQPAASRLPPSAPRSATPAALPPPSPSGQVTPGTAYTVLVGAGGGIGNPGGDSYFISPTTVKGGGGGGGNTTSGATGGSFYPTGQGGNGGDAQPIETKVGYSSAGGGAGGYAGVCRALWAGAL